MYMLFKNTNIPDIDKQITINTNGKKNILGNENVILICIYELYMTCNIV